MQACEQMTNLSVLEHGESVHNYFIDLYEHIVNKKELKYEWKLPEWVYNTELWNKLEDATTIKNYQVYHDCGKPYCLEVDDDGRKHFPNHAQVSYDIWKSLGLSNIEADLMLHDMDIHVLRGKDIENFCSLPYAATLLITGLCEMHSNAVMFGGIESTSFKIKWKNINKFGKRILENLLEKEVSM
jgi:hypothetical protein